VATDLTSSRGVVRWSRARRTAIVAVDSALAIGTGAVAGLWGASPVGAAAGTAPASGWTGIKAPLPGSPDAPATNPQVAANALSCASAVACVGGGYYQTTASNDVPLLETYANGVWSALEAPVPANAAPATSSEIYSVSCPTDASCVAVGGYTNNSGHTDGLIDTLSGGHWSTMEAPVPNDALGEASGGTYLKSVDCTSASTCVAIGSYKNSAGTLGFVDTLQGGAWAAQALPQPAGAAAKQDVLPFSVSCPSVGACAASGIYEDASVKSQAYLLSQGPSGWSAQDAPLPSDAAGGANENSYLFNVSCAVGTCEAVGSYKDVSSHTPGLIERMSGGVWSVTEAPLPGNTNVNPNVGLEDASCTFDGCVAVGRYEDSATGTRPLVETTVNTTGTTTAAEAPQPADQATGSSVHGDLFSVSCQSLNACTAVGEYFNAGGGRTPLIDSASGTTWAYTVAPLPSDATTGSSASGEHDVVSCTSRGACAAFGSYTDTSTHRQGLLGNFTPAEGYWTNAADGGVFTYGSATFHGSAGNLKLNQPVVGMAASPGNGGYWEVASDGGIFNYGDAPFYGSTGALKLNRPVVGMAASPDGGGYWLVAADGGIFNYGDAGFFGSTGAIKLNQPIVGMAATPDGHGYWLVAADGGIFNYGDAGFYGSRGGQPLNKPIVGMAATPDGQGYWLVASDGGIFTYGDAQFYGSTGAIKLNKPIVSMLSTFDGAGYFLVASDGGIFNYGDAGFYGSAGSLKLNMPVVSGAPS
jgi:hypothetical protein